MNKTLIIGIIVTVFIQSCNSKKNEKVVNNIQEKYRPQYHFSPKEKWMNDPNGMVYYNGEYHLFYQHNPDSTVWGPMYWGHAVSKDLVYWEHLPIALFPDKHGVIFSGSAVIDHNNTSGLGTRENPSMVAIFTYHNLDREKEGKIDFETQGIAYSTDNGRTWLKYQNNPVLLNPGIKDFRDPNVFWHEEANSWIMSLAVKDHIRFYSSPNLIDWKHESNFGQGIGAHGGVWECPDLFPMKISSTGETKWILIVSINPGGPNGGSATQYFVGDFDGSNFTTAQTGVKWIDYGTDNYAGVTWSNTKEERYFIGWMNNWNYGKFIPTETFRGSMTTSRKLKLKLINDNILLTGFPVKNYENSIVKKTEISDITLRNGSVEEIENLSLGASHMSFELHAESEKSGIKLKNSIGENTTITWDRDSSIIILDRTDAGIHDFHEEFAKEIIAPLHTSSSAIKIDIFIDKASLEVFVNEGQLQLTVQVFPKEPYVIAELFCEAEAIYSAISIAEFE